MKLTLIYFKDCPNIPVARKAITEAGHVFEEFAQEDLAEDHPYKKYSSPTILNGEQIVIGSKLASAGGGCSTGEISAQVIKDNL